MVNVIGIDSVVFIYLLEEHQTYLDRVRALLDEVQKGKLEAVMSVIGMIEILTGPKKIGRSELAEQYKQIISTFPHLSIVGIDERIVDVSSHLRARYRIRTPDAIHLATALSRGAKTFYTNDEELKKVKELRVEVIGNMR